MGKVVRCVMQALLALVLVLVCAAAPVGCSCSEESVPPTPGFTVAACKSRSPIGKLAPKLDPAEKTITPGAVSASFSVRSTGEAALSIALDEVPGRGVRPDLSLLYDSAGGDGPLGMGFSRRREFVGHRERGAYAAAPRPCVSFKEGHGA